MPDLMMAFEKKGRNMLSVFDSLHLDKVLLYHCDIMSELF